MHYLIMDHMIANEALELDKEATELDWILEKVGISYSFMILDNR